MPVGPEGGHQHLVVADKAQDGSVQVEPVMGVVYVPLTTYEHQLARA